MQSYPSRQTEIGHNFSVRAFSTIATMKEFYNQPRTRWWVGNFSMNYHKMSQVSPHLLAITLDKSGIQTKPDTEKKTQRAIQRSKVYRFFWTFYSHDMSATSCSYVLLRCMNICVYDTLKIHNKLNL